MHGLAAATLKIVAAVPILSIQVPGSRMTESELQAIRERLRKASSGPWTVKRVPNLWPSPAGDRRTHPTLRGFRVPKRMYELAPEQVERDAAFMADARQDVPALVGELDRLLFILHDVHVALGKLVNGEDEDVRAELQRIVSRVSEVR